MAGLARGRLAGRRAIITGAGSGIGRASAELFAAEGAVVIAADRDAAGARATAAAIGAAGGEARSVAMDAGNESDVAALVAGAVDAWGGLDIFYANAGISGGATPLLEQSVALWQEVLRVNLIGPFLAIRYAAPVMRDAGCGSIICTASVAGLRANAGRSAYAASKAGVISLVQTAANELYGTGVRVNAILPGLIRTGMTRPIFEGAQARGTEARIGQLNPLRRHGEPREIAAAALFLASDDSSYVNGQAYAVDGGLSSTHPFTRRPS
jgi:NAD(P)-dependent dehydrogenase (short-subunit alcohol dehydrogenase family)